MMETIIAWLAGLEFWSWWILGLVLIILEVFAPSTIFLWLGISAGVVGVVAWVVPDMRWEYQWIIFAGISVGSIVLSRLFLRKHPGVEDNITLNQRGVQYIGRQFTLTDAIQNGRGKIHVDDTQWAVEGPDLDAGAVVRVTGVDGTLLIVEPVAKT
ncbi:NfeD family protein [Sneathiella chungangensis]|uniref:NfeD family protein n=1 Tax=Sneathiella chungangensis TaxID=1418234 RepID=A0A845MEW5_9PROT|nr:NfeD family protein [Sneathiella chungangensis]MZR22593.1 NfeD family protein [Sneathiella chungangensis]